MSKPVRNADANEILSHSRTFFVTTKTSMGQMLLQSDRNAMLLIDVLRSNVRAGKFTVHDFVVMPNHLHVLMTVGGDLSVERAMQFIKGRFSYRLKKDTGEVWQRGFSEVRVEERASFLQHRAYIAQNPIAEGLASSADEFPYCYSYLVKQKAAGAKARQVSSAIGTTEVVP